MAINKSGKNLPIFSGWPSVDKGNQIGTIYNREVFIYGDTEDGVEVYFRNSSGRIVQGFYYATDANGNDLFSSNAEAMKALSSCIDYPFSTVTIGGTEYYIEPIRLIRVLPLPCRLSAAMPMKTDWRYGTCTKYLAVPTVPASTGRKPD